jgi:DNA-binding response OmpR family regulator
LSFQNETKATKKVADLKILLIEDEAKIAEFVIKGLSAVGYDVTHVDDGARGLEIAQTTTHDLIVLDVMLPRLNGFDLMHQLRDEGDATPIIILSAKADLPDRLMGFEMGADDYLPKPFFVEELVARIKAVMQRKLPEQAQQISVNHLTLDIVNHKVHWFDTVALLSQREFSLLAFLMRSPGHIYSRQQILKHVWEINFDPETNVVDVCVRRIKRKLERGSSPHSSPIESVRGVGYRLKVEG